MAKPDVKQYGGPQKAAPAIPVSPGADAVDLFHQNADVDVRKESMHHTLGPVGTQASPGDHNHDGGSSALLLEGFTITGSRSDGTALLSVIQTVVRLGAKDSSTP